MFDFGTWKSRDYPIVLSGAKVELRRAVGTPSPCGSVALYGFTV